MKRTSAVVLAIVSIIFFLGLASFAVWRGIDARDKGKTQAHECFQALSRHLVSAHASGGSLGSEAFLQQMRAEMSKEGAPLAILLNSSLTGEALYLEPPRSGLALPGNSERSLRLAAKPEWSTQLFSLPLALSDGSKVVFHAVYPTLTWGHLSRILSDSLYLIAAFFLLLLIVLIVQTIVSALRPSTAENQGEAQIQPIEPFSPPSYEGMGRGRGNSAGFEPYASSGEDEDEFPIPDLDGISASGSEAPSFGTEPSIPDLEFPSIDLPDPESLSSPQEGPSSLSYGHETGAATRGLYDPETGVGWEDFLEERLKAEIARAQAAGQELSLAIFAPLDQARSLSLLGSDIVVRFSFRDLVFGWKGRGIALILPGKAIEEALADCQDFLDRGMAGSRGGLSVRVGASSLSGRGVDAAKLEEEASGALERALQSEDSPIIGFKADPERYASYLSDSL